LKREKIHTFISDMEMRLSGDPEGKVRSEVVSAGCREEERTDLLDSKPDETKEEREQKGRKGKGEKEKDTGVQLRVQRITCGRENVRVSHESLEAHIFHACNELRRLEVLIGRIPSSLSRVVDEILRGRQGQRGISSFAGGSIGLGDTYIW
jgi:hypothetical protein